LLLKKVLFVLTLVLALSFAAAVPARADSLYQFTFVGPSVGGYYGTGIFDVSNTGVILDILDSDLKQGFVNDGPMTLLPAMNGVPGPPGLGGNDNLFLGGPSYFDTLGVSFSTGTGAGTVDYNLFYNGDLGCGGTTNGCVSLTDFGGGAPVNFRASAVPEPATFFFMVGALLILIPRILKLRNA